MRVNENNGSPTCSSLSWFGTNQKRCGHQTRSDWPLFGGTFILNLDNASRGIETYGLWTWLLTSTKPRACPTKIFISSFGRAFKVMKNGVYFIVMAFLFAELFKILVYANFENSP